jgi:hypothetical protein
MVMLFEMVYTRSVTIAPCISTDLHGKNTYGTAVTVPACVDYTVKNIRDFDGNTFITSAWIALPPTTTINYKSKVTLPNSDTSYVGSISEAYDEEAGEVLYLEVYLGRVAPGEGAL